MFVGDSQGFVTTYEVNMKAGLLQQYLNPVACIQEQTEITDMQYLRLTETRSFNSNILIVARKGKGVIGRPGV